MAEQIELANKLIALGDARKDPLLLMAAASLQKSIDLEPVGTPKLSVNPDDVLERAKAMASGRRALLDVASELGAAKSKGTWRIDAVSGRSTYRY